PESLTRLGAWAVNDPHKRLYILLRNLAPDGNTFGLVSQRLPTSPNDENRLILFNLNRRQYLCSLEQERDEVFAAFAPRRQLVATCTSNQTVTIWKLPDGSRQFVLTNAVWPLAFSHDERLLATAGEQPDWRRLGVKLWKVDRDQVSQFALLQSD